MLPLYTASEEWDTDRMGEEISGMDNQLLRLWGKLLPWVPGRITATEWKIPYPIQPGSRGRPYRPDFKDTQNSQRPCHNLRTESSEEIPGYGSGMQRSAPTN